MCINRNVVIGLGAVALGVLVLAPEAFLAVLPALVLLVCPLSMLLMMRVMARGERVDMTRGQGVGDMCCVPRQQGQEDAAENSVPESPQLSPELVRLRAEVDQLRAELAAGKRSSRQPAASFPELPEPISEPGTERYRELSS